MDPKELGSATLVASWLQKSLPEFLTKQQKDNVRLLFEWLVSVDLLVYYFQSKENCFKIWSLYRVFPKCEYCSGTSMHSVCVKALSSNGTCFGDASDRKLAEVVRLHAF